MKSATCGSSTGATSRAMFICAQVHRRRIRGTDERRHRGGSGSPDVTRCSPDQHGVVAGGGELDGVVDAADARLGDAAPRCRG